MGERIAITVDGQEYTAWTMEDSKQATLTEDGDIKCPWCGHESDDTYIWTIGTESGKWNIEQGIYSTTDSSAEFSEHRCTSCNKPIDLPEDL